MFDCVVTKFDYSQRLVEFNGADENQDQLARYIADHLEE